MGTQGKIVDVNHQLSPKVPIILSLRCGNLTKIWCKVIPNKQQSQFLYFYPVLGTNGDYWGLMGTKFHGDYR